LPNRNTSPENKVNRKKLVLKSQPELQKGINLIQKPDKLPVFQSLITSELEKQIEMLYGLIQETSLQPML